MCKIADYELHNRAITRNHLSCQYLILICKKANKNYVGAIKLSVLRQYAVMMLVEFFFFFDTYLNACGYFKLIQNALLVANVTAINFLFEGIKPTVNTAGGSLIR